MSTDGGGAFGPLEGRGPIGDPARVLARAANAVRRRRLRRRMGAGVAGVLVFGGLALVWPRSDEPAGLETVDGPADVGDGPVACGDEMPYFVVDYPAVGAEDPIGSPGAGTGSTPTVEGQMVSHWESDFDLVIEMRWPGSAVPADAPAGIVGPVGRAPRIWPDRLGPETERMFAFVAVEGNKGPCSVVSVEAYGPRLEPAGDYLPAFVESMRPSGELPSYLAGLTDETARASGGDRAAGACATLVPTAVDGRGDPDEESVRVLAERFLADRLAGLAAEPCLTRPGLRILDVVPPDRADLLQVCLYECEGRRLVAGFVQTSATGWPPVELVVDYEEADGSVTRQREVLETRAVPDGEGGMAVLISGVHGQPWSYVSETAARQVVAQLLDALAAQEYEIALGLLFNEGWSTEVEERLGAAPTVELLERFCQTASCAVPYEIGATLEASDRWRVLEVSFDTPGGAVTQPMRIESFEGIASLHSLPPDGIPTPVPARFDERLFGEPYLGDMTVVRYDAVERYRNGTAAWAGNWLMRGLDRFEVAGELLVVPNGVSVGGGASAISAGGEWLDITKSPDEYAGAGRIGTRNLAFTTRHGDEPQVVAHDLATRETFVLLDDDREEMAEFVDVGAERVAVLRVIGESTAIEVHDIDPDTLAVGPVLSRLDADGYVGPGHIAPDGRTVAATLDPSFYDPTRTVALFDVATTDVVDRWDAPASTRVERLDYDGRWIVAELSDDTLWVIDTSNGTTRTVNSPVGIRFTAGDAGL